MQPPFPSSGLELQWRISVECCVSEGLACMYSTCICPGVYAIYYFCLLCTMSSVQEKYKFILPDFSYFQGPEYYETKIDASPVSVTVDDKIHVALCALIHT